jgi:(1->4)-alpha-D-glucan 1-alpha-D-glucosylmutase
MTPRATYRLQFTAAFGFADAAALAPYLAALGISHVYASPIFAARPGSTHGYDVTDPNRLNPELGDEAAFRAMVAALRDEGLGLILDVVPNHMGIGGAANRFWLDVLEWGPESRFAGWFDIDWQSDYPGLEGKVLVPFLGGPYGEVLGEGGLELRFDPAEGSFAVWAHDTHKLPICPRDYPAILRAGGLEADAAAFEAAAGRGAGDPEWGRLKAALAGRAAEMQAAAAAFSGGAEGRAALDALIASQHWRASKFSLDGDAINYRRFFTISDLAGVRVELPEVFEATHELVLGLVGEGVVDGLRIDHIDGLLDPKAYSLRLRERAARPILLLVEKILAPDEVLPQEWGTDGTTGYEFANLLVGLLVDPAGDAELSRLYAEITGRGEAPEEIVHAAKLDILARPMAAELAAITSRLLRIAAADPNRRDLGRGALRTVVMQFAASLDVYRSYVDAEGARPEDVSRIRAALAEARRRCPALDPALFDFLEGVLTLELSRGRPEAREDVLDAVMRLQQLTGPVMAKGLEDTALYRYNRLIALNEVGSEPGRFGQTVEDFHRACTERAMHSPRAMLTTSTHDTKRGEDARARIAALSGRAGRWGELVLGWQSMLTKPGRPVDPNEAYFFHQLLLGAWPFEWGGAEPPAAELAGLAERVQAAMLKSVREAGVNTRWVNGDPDYEAALEAFVGRALTPGSDYLAGFAAFAGELDRDAMANSLIQTVLKLTAPGFPDIYQGAEAWDQSLVDPDNRRPVDFDARARVLAGPRAPWDDPSGAGKLATVAALLDLRRQLPALFETGSYEPLRATGPASASLCAFLRRQGDARLLVAVALHPGRHDAGDWQATALPVPSGDRGGFRSVVGGGPELAPRELFREAPFAVLVAG